jgi:hypothetical protein
MSGFLIPPTFTPSVPPIQLGTAGKVLTMVSGVPAFATPAAGGGYFGSEIAATPAAGANNNFDPGSGWPGAATAPFGILVLTDGATPGACNLTGLKAGLGLQQMLIVNTRATDCTLNNLNAGSLAANQFQIGPGDLVLSSGAAVLAGYSNLLLKWVIAL